MPFVTDILGKDDILLTESPPGRPRPGDGEWAAKGLRAYYYSLRSESGL
jgi:hypothetical protein